MKRLKGAVAAGVLVASLGILTGCEAYYETDVNGDKHRHEYDSDSGKFVEVDPEDGKETEGTKESGKKADEEPKDETGTAKNNDEERGFDSYDEVVIAFWHGIADCSGDEMKACFLDESVLNDAQYKALLNMIDEMAEKSESVKDTIVFDLDHLVLEKDRIDPEDIPTNISQITEVEKAYLVTVVVPLIQTINGDDYQVNDNYEMYAIKVDGRWYLDAQIDNLGADIVDGAVSLDSLEWCTVFSASDSIRCTYTNGVSDSFEIADGVTFGDLCDWFAKESPDFNRDTYRRVFSLNFGDESTFEQMKTMDASYQASVLGSLAELARRIDKTEGKALEMEVYVTDPYVYIYKVQCASYGKCELYVDSQTGDLKMIQTSTGNESEGTIKDNDMAGWEAAARHALNGEQP